MALTIRPSLSEFKAEQATGKPQLVYARLINDIDTPVSAYLKIAHNKPYSFLLESVQGGEQRGRYSCLGFAPDLIWRCKGIRSEISRQGQPFETIPGRPLDTLRTLHTQSAFSIPDNLPPMTAGLFGYLGYDMIEHMEPIKNSQTDPIKTPDGLMIRPGIICIFDQITQEIIIASPCYGDDSYQTAVKRIETVVNNLQQPLIPTPSSNVPIADIMPQSSLSKTEFCTHVETAKEYIRAGDIFQIVMSQRFEAPLPGTPFALYRALRSTNPSPFLYFLHCDDHHIVGSSPEILVRLRDNIVTIRPIAGTRPRGKTPQQDHTHEQNLLNDPKECAEHLMLLDLGRNDVGRVCRPKTVHVSEQFNIERYSHVMHIVSNVEGHIHPDHDAISALFAGFPAGTVSGAPKVRAMQIISELETEKRGIYAGAVGYISANGDMDTAIALRTAIIKNDRLHVRAGAGIVLDSDPDSEYNETQHKAAALFQAAAQSPVFESS